MENKKILNIKELSVYLNCCESTIRNLIRNRKIPYFRIGVKYMFSIESINNWLKNEERK